MRECIFILFTFWYVASFAQDAGWKKVQLDENMSIALPAGYSQSDTLVGKSGKEMKLRVFTADSGMSVIRVTITPNDTRINVDNTESLQIALKDISDGFCKSLLQNSLTCTVTDTTIDHIAGKKIVGHQFFNTNIGGVINYVFLVNDKMYMVSYRNLLYFGDEDTQLNQLINSIHFNHAQIREQRFGSKNEAIGYRVGYMAGKILVPLIIIILILVFAFRKKRNTN